MIETAAIDDLPPDARIDVASDTRVRWDLAEGLTAYPAAIARMEASIRAIRAGEQPEQVWFV